MAVEKVNQPQPIFRAEVAESPVGISGDRGSGSLERRRGGGAVMPLALALQMRGRSPHGCLSLLSAIAPMSPTHAPRRGPEPRSLPLLTWMAGAVVLVGGGLSLALVLALEWMAACPAIALAPGDGKLICGGAGGGVSASMAAIAPEATLGVQVDLDLDLGADRGTRPGAGVGHALGADFGMAASGSLTVADPNRRLEPQALESVSILSAGAIGVGFGVGGVLLGLAAIAAFQLHRWLVVPLRKLNHATATILRQAQVDRPIAFQPDFDVSESRIAELQTLGQSLEELGRWVARLIDVLRHQAFHDTLTGLPNEALLLERIRACLNRQQQDPSYRFAILTLELESLRALRYAFGYRLGDRWLQAIARRLTSCTTEGDTLARVDSHEFAMLLPHVQDMAEVTERAALIHESMEFPQSVEGLSLSAATTIGIYWGDGSITSPDGCWQAACTAMLYAQRRGRGQTLIFEGEMQESAAYRLELENELRRAIRRQQLHLLYQPIVSLPDRQLVGFEVLVRWNHPQLGVISPAEFIPLAERTGSIVPLGLWVLERACQQATAWAACFPHVPVMVNVNLSAVQLQQENLLDEIDRVLSSTGTPASLLKLEVTESILVEDTQLTIARLQAVRDRGIEVAIDDFGTGYSSLSYLQQLPVTTLKLDRVFVENITHDPKNYNIVRTVTALARDLDLAVVAEGIETEEQAQALVSLGCQYGQGYLFGVPLNCHEATRRLQKYCP